MNSQSGPSAPYPRDGSGVAGAAPADAGGHASIDDVDRLLHELGDAESRLLRVQVVLFSGVCLAGCVVMAALAVVAGVSLLLGGAGKFLYLLMSLAVAGTLGFFFVWVRRQPRLQGRHLMLLTAFLVVLYLIAVQLNGILPVLYLPAAIVLVYATQTVGTARAGAAALFLASVPVLLQDRVDPNYIVRLATSGIITALVMDLLMRSIHRIQDTFGLASILLKRIAEGLLHDNARLERARAAADAASQAKSAFLANMSHEIRTPMSAILGMLALLQKTELTVRQADYAGKSEGAARSLLGLLDEILDFSKVEAGKMTLDPHPFDIDRLLHDLSVILSANVGAKRIEVLFDIDPGLPRELVGDAMRLRQILINLSGNAIKFTAQGEVVLSLRVIAQGAGAVTVEFAVRDTGIGIAPENHARVFSGFTQAESSTTRRYGGTGLGVAISGRLVALMGGELTLDSALGQGSRFHFRLTLPVCAAAPGAAADSVPPGAPVRALVIDDNPAAREVLLQMGHALGWTIDAADSGEQALEILRAHAAARIACQVVLVDWEMPGWDGWETSRRIHEALLPGSVPVVVMGTAHSREMLSRRSAAEQALLDGFLVKPVTAPMLIDAAAQARAGREHPQPLRVRAAARGNRLAGMRLLLAEDNPNNQQVARELLEDEGAIVQIANNGKEAVAAVAAMLPPFDVVLMDLQMPVMDGFTATRCIRQDLGLAELPIVAMTANAMAADREACLAAGMNDHVGKPFDLNRLVSLLCRYAGRAPVAAAGAATVPDTGAVPAGLLAAAAAAGVDIGAAIDRMGGKQDLYLRMLGTFVRELEALPAQLLAQLARREFVSAAHLLHTLKGLAGTFGAGALAAAAAESERQLNSEPAPEIAETAVAGVCDAIFAAGPGLSAVLAALRAGDAAPEATRSASAPLEVPHMLQALRALEEQLQNADMAATDAMRALLGRAGATPGARLQALDEAVGALDFEGALVLCRALIGTLEVEQPA